MKNITVTLSDDIYHRARATAAEMQTSVSALVKDFLCHLPQKISEFEQLKQQEAIIRAQIIAFSGEDRVKRDELYRY
jgi:hypothetical protein